MKLNKKMKIIILSVFIGLCLFALILFVFPDPNSYLLEINIDKDNKKEYTLYQTLLISNEIENIYFENQLPENVDEFDENKMTYGSAGYYVVIDQYAYRFYRLSKEDDVLVTKSNKNNDYNIEQYALISKNDYIEISSLSYYTQYEDLSYWN